MPEVVLGMLSVEIACTKLFEQKNVIRLSSEEDWKCIEVPGKSGKLLDLEKRLGVSGSVQAKCRWRNNCPLGPVRQDYPTRLIGIEATANRT